MGERVLAVVVMYPNAIYGSLSTWYNGLDASRISSFLFFRYS